MTSRSWGDAWNRPSLRSRACASGRRLGRCVEHGDRRAPGRAGTVVPPRPGGTSPRGSRALDEQHPHRVDVTLGRLVPTGHVVGEVDQPLARDRLAGDGQRRVGALDEHLDLVRVVGGAAGRRLELGQCLADGAPSSTPGSSASVRSATISASASCVVSRSGRAIVSALVTLTVSPS